MSRKNGVLTCVAVGPIIEAFGFNRIIFATSSSSGAESNSSPGNWYEMAREAVAELGIDQDGVDAIFGGNAKTLYGAA
jgi:predicted TIM-barrel fold metal-dependent hydrolase